MRLYDRVDEQGRYCGFRATTQLPNGMVDHDSVMSYLGQRTLDQNNGFACGIVGGLELACQEAGVAPGTDEARMCVKYYRQANEDLRHTVATSIWYAKTMMAGFREQNPPTELTGGQLKQMLLKPRRTHG